MTITIYIPKNELDKALELLQLLTEKENEKRKS